MAWDFWEHGATEDESKAEERARRENMFRRVAGIWLTLAYCFVYRVLEFKSLNRM